MILYILSTAAGIAVAFAKGGTLESLLSARIQFPRLLAVATGLAFMTEFVPLPGGVGLLIVALLLVLIGISQNLHLTGVVTVGIGLAMNCLVLLVNAHMPVRLEALIGVGAVSANEPTSGLSLGAIRQLETSDTNLAFLGDIVPIGFLDMVVSFGDLIASAGLMIVAYRLFTRRTGVIDLDDLFEETPIDLREPQVRRTQPARPTPASNRIETDSMLRPSIRPKQADSAPPPPGPNPRKIGGATPLPDRPK